MASKKIELSFVFSDKYRVVRTTNTTSPTVGEHLTKAEVNDLIENGETTVVISEAKKRRAF
jgi:hypothetical protein